MQMMTYHCLIELLHTIKHLIEQYKSTSLEWISAKPPLVEQKIYTVKPVENGHSQKDCKLVSRPQIKNMAECILQYF